MILANLKLKRIDDIISDRTGLDRTGETYLVGFLANKTAFISRDESAVPLPDGPHSEAIDAAFRGEDGATLYDNYLGEPVIGVYRWLADQDVALLAEMSQTEAFAPARRLAAAIMLVSLGAAGILLLGVSRLAGQLSLSRQQIEGYSHQLEQTAAAANMANRAKSEFLANMSHELRTPLNAILGFTQLMQRDRVSTQSATQTEYLGIISRSGEHLLNLINDVLSMAKIEAGRTTFDPSCFDLRYLLLTLEEMLRMRAEAKTLQLFVEIGDTVPEFIKTDEMKLRQVLVNLVGNAIKFTQAGSVTLTVSSQTAPASAEMAAAALPYILSFSVHDTGVGIAPEEQSHLFDPFYQASKTRSAQQGTGLGLAISQRFIGLMGGQISVQSTPGEGSTFSFSIRALPADTDQLPIATGEVVGLLPLQPVYRILVVEDAAAARQLLVDLLSQVGFEVETAVNGEEAIARYQAWQPDLIWMDMRMPIMDGYEATRQIRAMATSPVKIIAITASAFEEERAAMLASGCDDLVRKPFRAQIIFEKMAEHLGVRYRYQTEAAPTLPVPAIAQPLAPDDLAPMPPDWLMQFHQAALEVDAEQLHQLIRQIPAKHHHLVEPLSTLTQNFCFDELIALTQTYA